MPWFEATGNVQEEPEPDRGIRLGKDRTDERERTLVGSIVRKGHPKLANRVMLGDKNRKLVRLPEAWGLDFTLRGHLAPRCKEGIHPGRNSLMRNTETPMRSADSTSSRPTARKVQLPSGNRNSQEANAASRKARGNHNLADRAICPARKGADVGVVNYLECVVKVANRGTS